MTDSQFSSGREWPLAELQTVQAMFALYAAWYNVCRLHSTVKTTPAVAAGVVKEP